MKMKAALLVFAFVALLSAAPPSRVVAIGDVHGAYDDFVAILRTASLIDEQGNWNGGNTILVQTGDMLDRGTQGRPTMDLLMRLQQQAPAKGGRVYPLLGNHEVMNLMGDLRYVPVQEFANYASAQSQKKRDDAYSAYLRLEKPDDEAKKKWEEAHPPGFFEQRDAFGPDGTYGKWLRKQDAIVKIGDTVFLHGGISAAAEDLDIKQMNERVREELRTFDALKRQLVQQNVILPFYTFEEIFTAAKARLKGDNIKPVLNIPGWLSVNQEGILWFRGYAQWTNEEGAPQIAKLLKKYDAQHFVVAHTVQEDGQIHARFQNQVFLIDSGMLKSYVPNGQASALEIQDGKFTAIYKDKRVPF
jgi:hypothetical protein